MAENEASGHLESERRQFREWLTGDRSEPFVLENSEDHCTTAVICPSPGAHLKMSVRYVLLQLGAMAPFCALKAFFYRLAGVKIGRRACISPGVIIDPLRPDLIELGDDVCLGMGCRLMTHEFTVKTFRLARLRIRSGAVIGGWSTLRSGVTVGENSTVGFNSYVNRDVPPDTVVAGVPARPLSSGESEEG
jgi:serine acetyltransferase